MTRLSLILIAGNKNSASNAAKITAWAKETKPTGSALRSMVEDWKTRGFVTAADAEAIKGAT